MNPICINSYENKFKNPQKSLQQSWFSAGSLMHISIERGLFKIDYLEGWRE